MNTTLKKPPGAAKDPRPHALKLQKAKIRTPTAWMMLKKPPPQLPNQLDPSERAWQTDQDPGK